MRDYLVKWRLLQQTGVHYINAAYLIGFGWSLLYSRFAFSPAMELPTIGFSVEALAYLCIGCGVLTLLGRDIRLLYFSCFAYMPYFIASWLFLYKHQVGMTAISSTFIQASLFCIVTLESVIRRGENG